MKLSIWHEFSSNHSGYFQIIGIFETQDDMEKASEILAQLLYDIAGWYEDNEWTGEASAPEVKIAKQYGFEWKHPIDFMTTSYNKHYAKAVVDKFRNVIELGAGGDATWMKKDSLQLFIQKLGADTAGMDLESYEITDTATTFAVKFEATAPDTDTIERVITEWMKTHEGIKREFIETEDTKIRIKWPYFWIKYFKYLIESLEKNGFQDISYQFEKKKLDV